MIVNSNYKDLEIEFQIRKVIEDGIAKKFKKFNHQIFELNINIAEEGKNSYKVNIVCYTINGNFHGRAKSPSLRIAAVEAADKVRSQMDKKLHKIHSRVHSFPSPDLSELLKAM